MSRALLPWLLLIAFAALATTSLYQESITGDEVTHLPAGYTYVTTGDFRLNPQHPPLIKALAAVPLLFLNLKPVEETAGWETGQEWVFGTDFLTNNRAPIGTLTFLGRLPMVAVGVLMGLVLYVWARGLWGEWPAAFVLFLYVFDPNILAHSGVVHTDVGVSCFSVLALYALWRVSRSGTVSALLWCGIGLGLALLSKYSGVVTVAVAWLLFLACWHWRTWESAAPDVPSARAVKLAVAAIALIGLPGVLVTVGFGFPEGLSRYVHGLTIIHADSNPHWEGFLWGEYSRTGFWYYYPLAEFWKTPIPALLCFGAALLLVAVNDRRTAMDWAFILLPIVAFHAAAMIRPASIGVRHILPVFPFVFLAGGATAQWVGRQRFAYQAAFGLLCVWYLAGTLRVYPHFIPYFNAFAGGPDGGIRYLDDSNIEWGQDFYRLRDYLDATHPETVRMSAFTPIRPEHYGIKWAAMSLKDVVWPQPGVTYCAGASYLQRSSLYNDYPGVRFHWLERYHPVCKLGWSLYVYRFSIDPADEHNPDVCFIPREQWYADAIETLAPIVARSPSFREARRLLAEVYAARGSWREARGDIEAATLDYLSAVGAAPRLPRYRVLFRDAVSRLGTAMQVDDARPAALYFAEAEVQFQSQNQGQALLALLRCLQREPSHIEAHLNLGSLFAQLGFRRLARREWEICLAIDANYGPARTNLAQLATLRPRPTLPSEAGAASEARVP